MSPLTQGLNHRSACDVHLSMISAISQAYEFYTASVVGADRPSNRHDHLYGAVIMTEPLREFIQGDHLMNAELRQAVADLWAKPIDLTEPLVRLSRQLQCLHLMVLSTQCQGRLSFNNHGVIPTLIFTPPSFSATPFPRSSPFAPLSFPSTHFPIPSNPIHPLLGEATPCNQLGQQGVGERCKLPQWSLGRSLRRHRLWCILKGKNSFDSNYYMDFCRQRSSTLASFTKFTLIILLYVVLSLVT